MEQVFDVAIIGGGINGCGCAADAASRGLKVILFEQDDLASKTSSSSTKLIHGGLRYLEYYEFSLVKKALEERQTLLTLAPHLVHPQAFILPYQKYMRPSWFLRLGLFLYDHLSRQNKLPRCKSVDRKKSAYFNPLTQALNRGFLFYDAATDDARLTLTNAMQARNYGAEIRPPEQVIKAESINNTWQLTIQPQIGALYQIQAKALINATGPWVDVTAKKIQSSVKQKLALIKGSHIVVPKLYEGSHAYFLQHKDKRVVFVIPFHGYSMIGTTDVPFNSSLNEVTINEDEIYYLITLTNSYFNTQLSSTDILYSWSGIRPLLAAPNTAASALSRDYSYEVSETPAPVITILGGKITTYRQLAEEIIDQLKSSHPQLPSSVTKNNPLPGSMFENMDFAHYVPYARKKYSWLSNELLTRYLYTYGTNTELFLSSCVDMHSMGKRYGTELYQVELDYLVTYEWAHNSEDVLFRRTKLGLSMDEESKQELADYLKSPQLQKQPYLADLECFGP